MACYMRPGETSRSVNLGSLKEDYGSGLKCLQVSQLDNGYQESLGSIGDSFKCQQKEDILPFYAASPEEQKL